MTSDDPDVPDHVIGSASAKSKRKPRLRKLRIGPVAVRKLKKWSLKSKKK